MKALTKTFPVKVLKSAGILVVVLLAIIDTTFGQIADCLSGTVMYGIFSPNNPITGGIDSSEIRSINFSTGAIGSLIGGRRYRIRKNPGGGTYYGSAAMAIEAATGRFFMMSQMGGGAANDGPKDIFMVDPATPSVAGYIVTGTTPASLDSFHFVKMGIPPGAGGFGYAIGVNWDSAYTAARFSPLVRFSTCNTVGCANAAGGIVILGYLANTVNTYKWKIYNGDIVFDNAGNMYYLSAAFEKVGTVMKYTDARLYRIDAANIPASAGTGSIPMTFVADYNIIDSTGVSGLALDNSGNLYLSVKRFTNNDPTAAYVSELYKSGFPGTATLLGGFAPIPPNTSLSDLGSCYFPTAVLAKNQVQLSGKYAAANASLDWTVNDNTNVSYFEVQRSDDGTEFETIAHIDAVNTTSGSQTYSYKDAQAWFGKPRFYRIRENMSNGSVRYYSNVVKVSFNAKIDVVSKPKPNPFVNYVDFEIQLKTNSSVNVRLLDKSGRILYSKKFNGNTGSNKITVNDFGHLPAGVYVAELGVDDEVVREKIIKNN